MLIVYRSHILLIFRCPMYVTTLKVDPLAYQVSTLRAAQAQLNRVTWKLYAVTRETTGIKKD